MNIFSDSTTTESLTKEQLELMARSDHDTLIDYLENRTRFDGHRIRLLLELGQKAVQEKMQGL